MKKSPAVKKSILGQPSWRIATRQVEAFITELGGHLGPVTFNVNGKKISPYSVAPWAEEKIDPKTPAILKALRGDFFCLPFGVNQTEYRSEKHGIHGEVANAKWKFQSIDKTAYTTDLRLNLTTKIRPGKVDKCIRLIAGHSAVYCRDTVSHMTGPMSVGHHAMIKFPDRPGSGIISTSPFVYGQTFYEPTEFPEKLGYSMLKPGAEFSSLKKVSTITGEMADLSSYPARRGFEDIVMLVSDLKLKFAWTAVTFPQERFVWFAIKNPRVLRNTVFWISNGGRHYAPWNGRHVNVMGLEEVTAYFHPGLAESVQENPISRKGYPTSIQLDPKKPTTINYIMAVAAIPKGFDSVASIEPTSSGVSIISTSGKPISTPIDLEFLEQA